MDSSKGVFKQIEALKPQAVYLFGSAARGEEGVDSDLDILIVQDTDKSFLDRISHVRSRIRTSKPLDIIVLTPQEAKELPKKSSFFSNILMHGKLIYGRT